MTGSDKHTLDVYIGTRQKIAELSLVAGTERELALEYNSAWQANGFAISPHLPLKMATFGSATFIITFKTCCLKVGA